MIRSICKALTVGAGLAVVASVAMAGVPDPTKSSTDGNYALGNARGGFVIAGAPMPAAVLNGYTVTVRDVGNTPLPGVTVSFNLPAGTLRAHSTQQFGQTAACGSNTVSKVTDANGVATIVPAVVGDNNAGTLTQVRANGVLLTSILVHSFDLVCESPIATPGKVTGFDFNRFRLHFCLACAGGFAQLPGADFNNGNNPQVVDGFDFNAFRQEFLCATPGQAPAPCTQTQCPLPCP